MAKALDSDDDVVGGGVGGSERVGVETGLRKGDEGGGEVADQGVFGAHLD